MRQVLLDTETTGLNPREGHRITEIGCLEMIDRQLSGNKFHVYLDPERDIDPEAAKITGLTREFLLGKPKFAEVVEEFLSFVVNAELIIHNAPFDLGFLNYELNLLQHPVKKLTETVTVFDTLHHARKMYPGKKNNLDALCERLGVSNSHRQYHGALLDANILADVYLAMTRGQTSFSWQTKNSNNQINMIPSMNTNNIQHDLKIIYATTAELALHTEYLGKIKTASKGSCIWSEV